MNLMIRLAPILFLVFMLLVECGDQKQESPANTVKANVAASPTPEKEKCDFSEFSPRGVQPPALCRAALSLPKPEYPPEAKERGIQGKVAVLMLVNSRTGLVERACVTKGDEALGTAAKKAALRARFWPYSKHVQEKYAYVQELLTYNFVSQ
jgi:TonB family protein